MEMGDFLERKHQEDLPRQLPSRLHKPDIALRHLQDHSEQAGTSSNSRYLETPSHDTIFCFTMRQLVVQC